jgi:hypothetical protein
MTFHTEDKQIIEREMSISHNDFYRLLPAALRGIEYQIDDKQINVPYLSGSIQIEPGMEHERKIASLVLPVLHVVFTFADVFPEDIAQFLTDFSRVYQRGGG